jgi:hypothetical protein
MTITLPWRLMTLHFSHMGFTDGLTFMIKPPLFASPGDPSARQIVRRHLDSDLVPRKDTDEVHPKLSGNVRQNRVTVADVNLEHGVRQRLNNGAFHLYYIIF